MIEDTGAINGDDVAVFELNGGSFLVGLSGAGQAVIASAGRTVRRRAMHALAPCHVSASALLTRRQHLAGTSSAAIAGIARLTRRQHLAGTSSSAFSGHSVLIRRAGIRASCEMAISGQVRFRWKYLAQSQWRRRFLIGRDLRQLRVGRQNRREFVPAERSFTVPRRGTP